MKKKLALLLALLLVLSVGVLAGCGDQKDADEGDQAELTPIVVGASTTPHAEILNAVKDLLKDEGYDLQVNEFDDYIMPNQALSDGDLDANYFQHEPYLSDYNEKNGTDLVPVAYIHYEPFGIYPGQKSSLDELTEGDIIAVPDDTTNEARAFLLLEAQGLLKVKEGAGLQATVNDIVENPKNLKFQEMDAAMVSKALPDVAFGVINGNNALLAGLNVSEDAVASEDKNSLGAETFANVVAVRKGDEERPEIQALIKALQSDTAKQFIEEKYAGAVVPVF